MNLILIGYRCSGKSSVGKLLAIELERDFIDTDELIEAYEKTSIDKIVENNGWEYFRDIERKVIQEVSEKKNMVIATGGGVVMDGRNIENLRKNSCIAWLKADSRSIAKRMRHDQMAGTIRPSLTGGDPEDEIKKVLKIREPFYKEAGDMEVDTNLLSEKEVADEIIKRLPEDVIG